MAYLTTYQVCEIARDTYVINEAGMAAMFLVIGEERALLIDTGVGMTDLPALIRSLTPLPYDVVLTHGHLDHIGGAAQFSEVYVHPADAFSLQPIDYDAIAAYVDLLLEMGSKDVYHCTREDIRRVSQMPRLKALQEGMAFDLGGRTLEVIETPGHTAGSCSLIDTRERILFSGDACNVNLLCLEESVTTLKQGLMKIKVHENRFDRNFNGHVGCAGHPYTMAMPVSVLDDALQACEIIIRASQPFVDEGMVFGSKASSITYGKVKISFDPKHIM